MSITSINILQYSSIFQHEIKSDYHPIWLSNPDLVLTTQVTVQFITAIGHGTYSDFCEHFKKFH